MRKKTKILTEAEVLEALHRAWTPHPGQVPVGKAIFYDKKYITWVQCGRKFGKSEIALYCLIRWALTNPGKECWYVGPYLKQVKRIAWRRLLNMIPKEYIKHISRAELEVTLVNDTIIRLEGSDNPDASRGFTVHFCVYEEFKDFHAEYHDECMGPNLSAFSAPLVVIGTPPSEESFFTIMADEVKKDPDAFYLEVDCYKNPHINHKAVKREEEKLLARGEYAKVQREFYGRFVKGTSGSVFPMLNREKHVMPHVALMKSIEKDSAHLEYYCLTDPGSTSAFGVLFAAINPYTKRVYILDEIKAVGLAETSTLEIWPRIEAIADELHPTATIADDDWYKGYDEAAAWFANEMARHHGVMFMPTNKLHNKKEDGLSLIKDLLNLGVIVFSDRCEALLSEMEAYQTDKNGKLVKKNDHLIDCLRYLFGAAMYDINEVSPTESKMETREIVRKSRRLDDEVARIFEDFMD